MPDDEKIIEAMTRAMCEAAGVRWFDPVKWTNWMPWKPVIAYEDIYRPLARRQLAAHRAMIKVEKEQNHAMSRTRMGEIDQRRANAFLDEYRSWDEGDGNYSCSKKFWRMP